MKRLSKFLVFAFVAMMFSPLVAYSEIKLTEPNMVKAVFFLHKRTDMTTEEFRSYWRDVHGRIALKIPGLKKYVQNYTNQEASPLSDSNDQPDGIAELWFDSIESLQQAQTTPEWQASADDAPNLFDMSRLRYIVVDVFPLK